MGLDRGLDVTYVCQGVTLGTVWVVGSPESTLCSDEGPLEIGGGRGVP